jgi:transposase InsO family protein
MGWKETCVAEERFRFIEEFKGEQWSMAELCRRYGVSRKTGYKWLERYEEAGLKGLNDRSRAALSRPNAVAPEIAEVVLDFRRQHPHWGPEKLRAWLERDEPRIPWPAASTIGEMLKRAGLTVPRKRLRKATPSQSPLQHAGGSNQVWCVDFKGCFRCGDGSRCDPLTITDAYSRYLLRCQIVKSTTTDQVRGVMEAAFREYGLPVAIRSDNGEPFASVGLAGLSALSVWWIKLRIQPERIPPGKPQYNGRHERMHRSLKQATARPPAANLRAQQYAFDKFRREYNEQRPHEALGMKTPADFYEVSPRPYPSRLREPEYGDDWQIRRVMECGRVRWWNGKLFVGKAFAGEYIGFEPLHEELWRVWFYEYPLGIVEGRRRKIEKLK